MRKLLFISAALALCCLSFAQSVVKFTDANRIRYDGQCFTINGRDTFIYSGAFHYFRCPKELWEDRLKKIKAAGFNTVETYVPWNYHEKGAPSSLTDFGKIDLRECQDFLKMAIDQFGLNVIIRPGPYICSEWDTGGYPQWLMKYEPKGQEGTWLRSNDPVYLDWCRHWYKAVCPVIAPFQITHRVADKPGVILFQIENEYDYSGGGDDVHVGQLKALADQAHQSGIDVPLITCWTHQIRGSQDSVLNQVMDCCNFYPRWDVDGTRASLDKLRKEQPYAPVMVMELQGGWFSENGGLLAEDQPGINAAQINNLTLYCIQNGLTALNYYMLFGGTNFGDRTPPNITTSYDYFAPIREDGAVGMKYQAVAAIGAMLQEHGARFARSRLLPDEPQNTDPEVGVAIRVDPEGNKYVFVRNRSHSAAKSGETTIAGMSFHYDLEPFGSKILYIPKGTDDPNKGAWLPRPQPDLPTPPIADPVRITTALKRTEDGGSRWMPAQVGVPLNQQGLYDARYVVYSAKFDAPHDNHMTVWLKTFNNEQAVVRLNGHLLRQDGSRLGYQLFTAIGLQPTGNEMEILLENAGYDNIGENMDSPRGLESVSLVTKPVQSRQLDVWYIKKVASRNVTAEVADAYGAADFRQITIEEGKGASELNEDGANAVYREGIALSQADIDSGLTLLEFGSIDDDGWVYVNGKLIGEHHRWDTPAVFDFKSVARVGANNVAVVVHNRESIGGLTKPVYLVASPQSAFKVNWMWTPMLEGVRDQWFWSTNTGDEWETDWLDSVGPIRRKVSAQDANTSGAHAEHLISWYKMSFTLPAKRDDEATRRLLLDTAGNGFVYLNGHLLGRIWQKGPQREFFLPEQWLNWNDKPNDLTICLRPVNGIEAVHGAEISAYPDRTHE